MKPARRITVEVPAELLEKAQRAGGTGITRLCEPDCNWWRPRTLVLASGNSEAGFDSAAPWPILRPTDDCSRHEHMGRLPACVKMADSVTLMMR